MLLMKLAWQNILKNKRDYYPFIFSSIVTVILNVVVQLISRSDSLLHFEAVKQVLGLGQVVIGIFSLIFLIYTYSYLVKGRQREFGLYNVLGMSKGDLLKISFYETVMTLAMSLVIGLISGIVFAKGLFLLLVKLMNYNMYDLAIAPSAFGLVAVLYVGIFAILFMFNALTIMRTKAVNLLHAAEAGERPPRSNWLVTLVGVVLLAWAYWLSLTVQSPIQAILQFFIAVIMVILATYALFIAGSVTILKWLQKRDSFFYRPTNFISISSMQFRLRKNGMGLANIALLTTMTLVTLITTVSLYVGQSKMLDSMLVRDYSVSLTTENGDAVTPEAITKLAKDHNLRVKDAKTYHTTGTIFANYNNGTVKFEGVNPDNMGSVEVISEADFKRLGNSIQLNTNEAGVYAYGKTAMPAKLNLFGNKIETIKPIETLNNLPTATVMSGKAILVVVPDEKVVAQVWQKSANHDENAPLAEQLIFDVAGSDKAQESFIKALSKQVSYESRYESRRNMAEVTGGLLFIGLMFGFSFILATGLIIYYKQITEGAEDQKRFEILQKVGMSHDEVKQTINGQIVAVFFLPIAVAVVHTLVAMPMITKILNALSVDDMPLIVKTTAAVMAVVVIIYYVIYRQTSKIYYRYVER